MTVAPVNKIIPFSFVDGPGNRTAIFLQGCNLNCLYCHNPETINMCMNCGACVDSCPTGALTWYADRVSYDRDLCCDCDTCLKTCQHGSSPKIRWLTPRDVLKQITPNLPFIDGVTVSGGECTLHTAFMSELFMLVKQTRKTTFIDTNGQTPLWEEEKLLEHLDYAMIDLKSSDRDEHRWLTGGAVDVVIQNIRFMASVNKLFEIRTVIIPELLDNARTVQLGSELVAPYPTIRYKLIAYRPFGVREGLIPPFRQDNHLMDKLRKIALENGVKHVEVIQPTP